MKGLRAAIIILCLLGALAGLFRCTKIIELRIPHAPDELIELTMKEYREAGSPKISRLDTDDFTEFVHDPAITVLAVLSAAVTVICLVKGHPVAACVGSFVEAAAFPLEYLLTDMIDRMFEPIGGMYTYVTQFTPIGVSGACAAGAAFILCIVYAIAKKCSVKKARLASPGEPI